MTDDISELLKTIRAKNVNKKLKVEIYAEIKKCIELNKGTEVQDQDLYTVGEDLDNSDDEIREAAWNILNLCKIKVGSEIFNRLIKFLNEKNGTLQVCTVVEDKLISSLRDYIKTADFNIEELLKQYQNEAETIASLFIEMCKSFSKTETADFVYYNLFPFIFNTENEKLRDAAIEIGMGITSFNTLTDLDAEKHKTFLASVENEYILSIRNVFGKMKHSNWHKMFILLIRYGGIIFHQRVDITNAILKIAEGGFKSSSIDNKLFAFDCWKELINNYSLNLKHMTMPKHIKLLVTPLKANLSSNEAVIHKRFEVWVHLLKKLGDNAVVCLENFLNFCFGPLGANPLVAIDNPRIASPGKKVVRLYNKSPKFLLEVIGHYGHSSNDPCINCEEELKLGKPILNSSNFETISTPVIHSIGESCLILSKWNSEAAELSRVIQCMWGSLLNLIKELNSNIKEKVLEVVKNQVLALSKVAENDTDYLDNILIPIINTIMNFECANTDDSLFKPVLGPTLKYLNSTGKFNMTRLRRSMDVAFSSKRSFIKVRMFGDFCDLINEIEKVKLSYPLWITLSHFVPDLCSDCPINEVFSGYLLSYMLWPVNNYNNIPEDEKQNLINTWKALMEDIYKNSAPIHKNHHNFLTSVVHSFQKIIKKNPLVINSVSLFLPLLFLDSMKNDDLDPLFISDLLQLILDLLDCPLTSSENISKLAVILTVCVNHAQRHPNGKADLIYEKLFKAIQYFLQPHQKYNVLDKLENILSENSISKEAVPPALISLVTDLTLHKDSEISRRAIAILSLLKSTTTDDTFKSSENFIENSNSLISRSSAKKMVQKSSKPVFIENTRVIQQLLEENTSPMKLKGSQLKNSPKISKTPVRSSSTTKKLPSRADKNEKQETYVVIENNYKFDKRKLTEHQKEKMKKRREDIPALYQDLSQSQTDCTSNSLSSSQDDVIDRNLKVIVKRMPSLEHTASICNAQDNDNSNKNSTTINSHLDINKSKENTSYDDMQQMELIINDTNKIEQKSEENVMPTIASNEDIFAGTNEKETNKLTEKERIKRNKRISNELSRLKMNIVGGDININLNEKRKSRRSVKLCDKTNSPFFFQNEKDESAEALKFISTNKNVIKMKRKNEKTKANNSNNTNDKEPPKRKHRKTRSQSLTHEHDEARVIKNNLKQRSRSNSETKECNSLVSLIDQNSDHQSEDIIESSQDSYVSIGKSFSKTFSSSNQASTINSTVNGEVRPLYTGLIHMINHNDEEPNSSQSDTKIQQPDTALRQKEAVKGFREKTLVSPTNEKLKETEKEQKSDTMVISEEFSPDKLIRKDLDQIEKITKREIEIAEANTESPPKDESEDFETCSETVEASSERTMETQEEQIVSCTKEEKDTTEPEEKHERTPSLFDSEADNQKDCEANVQHLEEDTKIADANNKIKIIPQQQQPPSRSARLVGLVTTTNSVGEKSPHTNPFLKRKSDAISFKTASTIFSPKTSRVRKMLQNCEDQKPLFVIDLDEEVKEKIPENQLLQFNREVPSPLATPKGSILKRKREFSDYLSDDNLQIKRKRVNFSDPPTTCKKIFIQHQDELVNRHRGIKKSLLLTTKSPTKEIHTTSTDNDHNSVIVIEEEYYKAKNEKALSESYPTEIEMSEESDKIVINGNIENHMDIESVEDSNFLDDVMPICPDLIDSLESVEIISDPFSSSSRKSAVLEEFNKKNIFTIGDLAFLTEKKITGLSLDPSEIIAIKRFLLELKEVNRNKEANQVIDGDIEYVLDSENSEKTVSLENINVVEESDLNSASVLINGEPNMLELNELKIESKSNEHNLAKLPEKKIAILGNFLLRSADIEKVQSSTNRDQPHCLESEDQTGLSSHNSNDSPSFMKVNSPEPSHANEHVRFDEAESFVREILSTEASEEKLEKIIVSVINKLSNQDVLKRLTETIIDKIPSSVVWKIFCERITKRVFVNKDCE